MAKHKSDELADYLEAHKDDTDEWEAEPADIRVAREPGVVFSLRIRPSELDRLQKIAERQGTTVSALIREAVDHYLQASARPRITIYGSGGPFSPERFEGRTTAPIARRDVPEQDAVTA